MEISDANPITAFQVELQMIHRLMALGIFICVLSVVWKMRERGISGRAVAFTWLGLICVQVAFGAWTIWSDKAADIATLHVVIGALSLVTGATLCIILFRGKTETKTVRAFAQHQV